MKFTYQNILYGVFGILVVASIIYFVAGLGTDATQAANDDVVVGKELLDLFDKMKLITLDQNIFSNPVFNSLNDFGLDITPQPVGRNNPFAPLGTSNSTASSTTDTISIN